MEITLEWGHDDGLRRLKWTPDVGSLIRLYRPVVDGEQGGVRDGDWVQVAALSSRDIDRCRAFFDAVDALR